MSWYIAVVTLVDSKEAKEMTGGFQSSGIAFSLPEESGQIVGVAEDCSFSDIKGLGYDI